MRTLVFCCISILLVLEVVYINMSGFFDFKDLVGKDRLEQFDAWFYHASDKELTGYSFKHFSKFGSIEVNIEETSLNFVLNNNKRKGNSSTSQPKETPIKAKMRHFLLKYLFILYICIL